MPIPITLKVFRGSELVRTEQFSREIIKIGRLATAHLCLDDEKISRIHSVIEVSPEGAISIIDMGSAEGTFVNGKKVSRGVLKPGDQITLGGLRIVLEGAETGDRQAQALYFRYVRGPPPRAPTFTTRSTFRLRSLATLQDGNEELLRIAGAVAVGELDHGTADLLVGSIRIVLSSASRRSTARNDR